MFFRKKKTIKNTPVIIEQYMYKNLEITKVRTTKPIKSAKSGIRIDN